MNLKDYPRVIFFALLLADGPAFAQQNAHLIAPNNDSCETYAKAMSNNNVAQVLALNGWATGYLSGIAQATGIDFLYTESAESISKMLFQECMFQPKTPLSLTADNLAQRLIAQHR